MLWINQLWLVLVVFITSSKYKIVSHAPSIDFVALVCCCIAVMTTSCYICDTFAVQGRYWVWHRKVVDSEKIDFHFLVLFRLAALLGWLLAFLRRQQCFYCSLSLAGWACLCFSSSSFSVLFGLALCLFETLLFDDCLLTAILAEEIANA